MGLQAGYLYGFNAGVFAEEALQRVDQSAARVAGETQVNLLPRVLGAAVFRPGSEYLIRTPSDDEVQYRSFVFSAAVSALLEFRPSKMRVIVDGAPVSRASVSTTIANSTFSALGAWVDDSEPSGSASVSGGRLVLSGNDTDRGKVYQAVSVSGADDEIEHAVELEVIAQPVYFSIGTTSTSDDIVSEQLLLPGVHSLAFTPGASVGTVYVSLSWDGTLSAEVEYCRIASAGDMNLDTPWATMSRIKQMQMTQSGDVMYVGHEAIQPRKIERRSQTSWSIVYYRPEDGPFQLENTSDISITPSSRSGTVVLTASRPLFYSGHNNTIWRLTHQTSQVEVNVSAEDTFTDPIRVSGIEDERTFRYVVASGLTGTTVTIQRAFGQPSGWVDYEVVTAGAGNLNDERANEIIYYRIGVKTGDYGSGSADVRLRYENNSQSAVVRLRNVVDSQTATADVLGTLGAAEATKFWNAPEWSGVTGWPRAVGLFDGRLWWGGRDRIFGSVSDAYESFDDFYEGDAGTINRSVSSGSFERILWILSLQRLIAGTATEEVSMRASSFDDPITPTEFTSRAASSRGSADKIGALKIDSYGIFVQRNGTRVFELSYQSNAQDYTSVDITRLAPDVCKPGVAQMAVQRTPDTRVWCVLSDGTMACLLYERDDDVVSWVEVEMEGATIESVAVLPGVTEDEVYVSVLRGSKRTLERFARLDEVVGGVFNKNLDGHVVYDGSSTTTITGLDHLNGLDVSVWADGTVYEGLAVSSGSVTLPAAQSQCVVGLPYTGRFKSVNLDYGSQLGVAVGRPQKITGVSLVMKDVGWKGVRVGSDFNTLKGLPATYNGRALDDDEVFSRYVHDVFAGHGYERDARLAFEVTAPYPATFLGALFDVETGEGLPSPGRNG